MRSNTVCVDNHFLMWGIRKHAEPEDAHMIERATAYLLDLEKKKTKIVVPSIVLTEFLLGIKDIPIRESMEKEIHKRCMIYPYDTSAARTFISLWRAQGKQVIKDIQRNQQWPKAAIKADCMIVAIAVSRGIELIISHDKLIKRFAGTKAIVNEIPIVGVQQSFDLSG